MLFLLFAAAACTTTRSRPDRSLAQREVAIAEVRRPLTFGDAKRQYAGFGMIKIAVRAVDAPTTRVEAAFVELRSVHDSLLSRRPAQPNGSVAFDSVPAGTYAVVVSRIGMRRMRLPTVTVDAGCRVDVEAYLRVADMDYYPSNPTPPPRTPARATITYCYVK